MQSQASRASRNGLFSRRIVIKGAETSDSDDMTPKTLKAHKEEVMKENLRYRMGYITWYSGKHGYWKAFKDFWGAKVANNCWMAALRNIGSAIGVFLMKRFILDRLGFQQYYEFKA